MPDDGATARVHDGGVGVEVPKPRKSRDARSRRNLFQFTRSEDEVVSATSVGTFIESLKLTVFPVTTTLGYIC
jgi:hypothetical protein